MYHTVYQVWDIEKPPPGMVCSFDLEDDAKKWISRQPHPDHYEIFEDEEEDDSDHEEFVQRMLEEDEDEGDDDGIEWDEDED